MWPADLETPRIRDHARARIDDLPDSWFVERSRTQREAFDVVYGPAWADRPVPVSSPNQPAALLSRVGGERLFVPAVPVLNCVADEPTHLAHPRFLSRNPAQGRKSLRLLVSVSVHERSLGDLIEWAGRAFISRCYMDALFEVWLEEEGFPATDCDALRMLVALGGARTAQNTIKTYG